MNEKVISASLLSATTAVAVFTSVMPSVNEVSRDAHKPQVVRDTRAAERVGAVIVMTVGFLTAYLVRDPMPAGVAVMVAGGMVVLYESVLTGRNRNGNA